MAALCPVVYATSVASPAHVATKPSARFLTHATDTASFSSLGNQTRSRCHGSAERGHGIAARPWQDPTLIPDGWLLPAQSCLPSSTRVAASSCTLLSGLGRRKGGAALSFELPVVSTNIHWSTGEAQGMEDNVNTEATGADSSTSCDDSSTNSSHSSRSGGRNEGRVTPPASDGGRTTTAQRSPTGAAEDDDEDGRDFGEESRPLCLPRAPVDRAGMPSECSTNDTAAAVPEQLMERAAPSNDSGSRCSSSTRRSSLVHTRNDGTLHTYHDNTAPHRDATTVSTGAAAQRSTEETNNVASDSTEVSPVMETSGGYTRSGSSSTQVEGRGNRGAANSAGQDAAVPRPSSEEEVSVVSAEEEESQFLDAEDAETAGLVTTASPGAAAERLDDRREEAAESRSDVCERRQAPDQPQRPEPQQPSPPQEQQSPPQQQQSPRQPEQRSPQEEDQQREPPEQQQQRLSEEQQVPPAEQPQQQPAEQRQGAEQEEQQRQQQQRQERAGGRQRQERRSRQRDRELIGRGAERGALRFWSADEEMYSGSATDSRAFLRGGLDLEGEVFFPADAPESQMRSRDRRDARQQQASHGGEEEEQEENHAEAEGGAVAKSEENSSSDDDEEEGAASSSHKKSFGCQHYRRRCKVVAPCCGQRKKCNVPYDTRTKGEEDDCLIGEAFWCRHCHNDVKCEQEKDFRKAHEIDRTAVTEVICAVCDTRQEVSNQCVSCKVEFGKYYCEKCKFWDDKGIKKKVYHCDLCGLCRTGGADSFFHCTTCGSCYSTDIRGSHKCVEKAMHQPCPICCENMFTSIRQVHVLKCGHTLHADCLERLKSECSGMPRLRCPLCFRSLGEYSVFWRRLDEEVARTPLPQELRRRVSCTCNDCAARTEVDYHVVGLKCGACGSYNTREVGP